MCTNVVASKVVNIGFGQHRVVLELRLSKRRRVSGDDDQLGLARSKSLEG